MNNNLQREIIKRLIKDFQFKEQNGYLRQGVCPHCKKKELFTSLDKPYVLRCGRENKCGAEVIVKEHYADLFDNWSERYQRTDSQPHAAAEAYLREGRGLDTGLIAGCYSQESYYSKGMGSATVRFSLPNGGYWERLIDRPERFDRKANFSGRYAGQWWARPAQNLAGQKEIWLVEGIFDAISLNQNGVAAVSLMTCNNYPDKALQALAKLYDNTPRPVLVWALDRGQAGERAIRKHIERSRAEGWTAKAALPPDGKEKSDWNDLHLKGKLSPKDLETYRYFGALLTARSASDKALLIFNRTERHEFHFEYDSRLYWFKLDVDRHMKAVERIQMAEPELSERDAKAKALKESGAVSNLANCHPTALYYQKHEATDEAWYYMRVDFPGRQPAVKATFTAAQLASSAEFKKRLLHVAKGAIYTGNSRQLDEVMKHELPSIREVRGQDFIGYNKAIGTYVFNDVAVHQGAMYTLNDEDYFEIPGLSVKSLSKSPELALNTNLSAFNPAWCEDLWQAFGPKGYITLAFWLGSLFAEQIRARHSSFMFLELVGEPGSGKTTLLEFLWRLSGRPGYEGFNPSKSTLAGCMRYFAQVGNLPVCLTEADRDKDELKRRGFNFEDLKDLYDGRGLGVRGVKTNDNATREAPFKGSILIAQNAAVDASEAILGRIVQVYTDRSRQSVHTKAAVDALAAYPVESVSGFVLLAALKEQALLGRFFECYERAEAEVLAVMPAIHNRIVKNHAQLIALVDVLPLLLPVTADKLRETKEMLLAMAAARLKVVQADHPSVLEFWELFDFLDSVETDGINHSRESGEIAVQFNHFQEVASLRRQSHLDIKELKKYLETAKGRKLVRKGAVRSRVYEAHNRRLPPDSPARRSEVQHCWIFQAK